MFISDVRVIIFSTTTSISLAQIQIGEDTFTTLLL